MAISTIEMLNQVLNPFNAVRYRGDLASHSRSMHTSFEEKVGDTFEVISGGTTVWGFLRYYDPIIFEEDVRLTPFYKVHQALRTRPGIFDYVTLGLFRGLDIVSSL